MYIYNLIIKSKMQNIDKKSHRTFHFLRESQCQCVKTLKNPSVFGEGSSNPVIFTLQIFFYNNNKKSNTANLTFSVFERRDNSTKIYLLHLEGAITLYNSYLSLLDRAMAWIAQSYRSPVFFSEVALNLILV